MAGGWATTVKIGTPTKELSLTKAAGAPIIYPFRAVAGKRGAATENLSGQDAFGLQAKFKPRYSVKIEVASAAVRDALESLYAKKQLSFIFADAWKVYSEECVLATTTTIQLAPNPFLDLDKAYNTAGGAAIVSGFKVFTVDDPLGAPGGTDYFAGGGGAYARATQILTLNSSPGAAGTTVYVTYAYTGALVRFSSAPSSEARGLYTSDGLDGWVISFELEGA